jgi:hypothetical protein
LDIVSHDLFEWYLIKVLLYGVLGRVDVLGVLLAKELYSFKVMFGKA